MAIVIAHCCQSEYVGNETRLWSILVKDSGHMQQVHVTSFFFFFYKYNKKRYSSFNALIR